MTTLIRARRTLAAALMLVLFLTVAPLTTPAGAIGSGPDPQTGTGARRVSRRICDVEWRRSTYQLKRLIRCAARRWRVAGGPDKAVRVARCESRFNARAYNPGGYAGVYQQATRYWRRRARTYGFRDSSVYNGRANVMVSVRMAHRAGWDAWSCA
jgi:hypothetical protein